MKVDMPELVELDALEAKMKYAVSTGDKVSYSTYKSDYDMIFEKLKLELEEN